MSREIKFRAWNGKEYIHNPRWQVCYNSVNTTLEQYTGLLDKNGVEIYEGDIFKAPHDFGPGGFSERTATVAFDKEKGYQWNYWLLDELEVIGNTHQGVK